ncbi:MAG: iron ABC transporter permease [Anaerolineales bacterium]|jgi:thiamine transport system permease protein
MDPGLDGDDTAVIARRKTSGASLRWILWLAPLAFLGLFFFYPLGRILSLSLSRSEAGLAAPFVEALRAESVRGVLGFTVWQAFLSTLLTLLVGLPGAYLFWCYTFWGKSLLRALTGVPFVMPTLVVAMAFNSLLGPRGWANLGLMALLDLPEPPIHFMNTFGAILLAHIFYNTTIVLRLVGDFWSHLDPRLQQAARVLGATPWQSFWRVSFPLLMPAIAAAALLVFIFDFTSFGVILVLGGLSFATLEVEIYYQTISLFNLPMAAVLSVIQLGATLGLTVIYTRLSARVTRPLSLRPRTFTQNHLTNWRSRVFAGVLIFFLVVLLVTPLVSLAARSVTRLDPDRRQHTVVDGGLTLDFYKELSINRRESMFYAPPTTAILTSLGYAGATVFLALTLGLPASWALAQGERSTFNKIIDPILMLPLGTSAVTLGLGFIVALNKPPLDLLTSPGMIPLAHTLVAFPFVVRSLTPALRSIQPRLRQAAAVLGATPRQVFTQVDLPMVGRALLVSATFAFTISIGEFGATALVGRPEYPTIPVAIYRFLSQPGGMNYGQALALSTILMAVTTTGMLLIERARIADVAEF